MLRQLGVSDILTFGIPTFVLVSPSPDPKPSPDPDPGRNPNPNPNPNPDPDPYLNQVSGIPTFVLGATTVLPSGALRAQYLIKVL